MSKGQLSVFFDKSSYSPGDAVRARFTLHGPFHKNLRKAILSLESGETTKVTVSETDTDMDGDDITTTTT